MIEITNIKPKARSKNIYLIYTNGTFSAEMLDESVVKFSLSTGKTFSEGEWENVVSSSREPLARHMALSLLNRSSKTLKQLKDYLFEKGFKGETVQTVAQKMQEYGFINDHRYAENYISSHPQKGKKAISFELKMRGISQEIITEIVSNLGAQTNAIEKLADKFLKNKDPRDPLVKQKLFRHLASKGFEFGEINTVISKKIGAHHESWN